MAYVTTNKIVSGDYKSYVATREIISLETVTDQTLTTALKTKEYAGISVAVDGKRQCGDMSLATVAKTVAKYGKRLFVEVPEGADERECALLFDAVRSFLAYDEYFFMFSSVNAAEIMHERVNRHIPCVVAVKTKFSAALTSQVGYNTAQAISKITASYVEKAHSNRHLVCALGSQSDLAAAQNMRIDYLIIR